MALYFTCQEKSEHKKKGSITMTDYAAKEEKLLTKIATRMETLEAELEKMENTTNRFHHFAEQEKALHEIRAMVREENKISKDEDKEAQQDEKAATDWLKNEDSLVAKIDKKIADLDDTLEKLNDDNDEKVKSYLEQKKAIDDIKSILKTADKL